MRKSRADKEGLTVYELGYLILPSIPEDKLSDVVGLIRKVVNKEGGAELDAEAPFKHPLSYSMSKTIGASRYVVSDAYLGWMKFEVEPEKISVIKDGVEKIGEVLRFLLIKAPRETIFTFAQAAKFAIEKKDALVPSSTEEAVLN